MYLHEDDATLGFGDGSQRPVCLPHVLQPSFIIISVLFITLTCNLPEWCDKIKLSNLLQPRYLGNNPRFLDQNPKAFVSCNHAFSVRTHALSVRIQKPVFESEFDKLLGSHPRAPASRWVSDFGYRFRVSKSVNRGPHFLKNARLSSLENLLDLDPFP